jgi:hypothetical protein
VITAIAHRAKTWLGTVGGEVNFGEQGMNGSILLGPQFGWHLKGWDPKVTGGATVTVIDRAPIPFRDGN